MLIAYNIIQILLIVLFFPVLAIYIGLRRKYRRHIPARLGFGLQRLLQNDEPQKRRIWIHALSVGEVTSALPLAATLHGELEDTEIVFSATTKTGYTLAQQILSPYCRAIIPSPLDLLPLCRYYLKSIKPDIFILVETDFWPNWLHLLQQSKIPIILVNGRISAKSVERYSRYGFFFKPMFHTLSRLCVQTESDRQRFGNLGVPLKLIDKLGNLKYEPIHKEDIATSISIPDRKKTHIMIAGSTHGGEEEILFDVFKQLRNRFQLKLIIAPRNPKRSKRIVSLAESTGLSAQLRSENNLFSSEVLILDTIGELSEVYSLGDFSFIGGSLVNKGGHNPLEPAYHGKPVMFGVYMSDFEEISQALVACGGGVTVPDQNALLLECSRFLEDANHRRKCGNAAQACTIARQVVVRKHVELIRKLNLSLFSCPHPGDVVQKEKQLS